LIINPVFNKYRITDTPPILWNVLGFPGSFSNQQSLIYLARSDVQAAIHVPNINWIECTNNIVFVNGIDQTSPSVYSIPPNVIEKIIVEGTRTVIQSMTWHGMQEFQVEPNLGFVHTERDLTYVELALCGHMVPQFQ